jgi:hypothetical protein
VKLGDLCYSKQNNLNRQTRTYRKNLSGRSNLECAPHPSIHSLRSNSGRAGRKRIANDQWLNP